MVLCGICYKRSYNVTECGHHFCRGCLIRWGRNDCKLCLGRKCGAMGGKITCPACRQVIASVHYPNTRSNARRGEVAERLMRLFKNMNEKTGKARLDAAEILIKNLWAERVTLRHCLYVSTSMKHHAERFAKQLSEVGRKIPVELKYLLDF